MSTAATIYTIGNLKNDALSLAKSISTALIAGIQQERSEAWYESAIGLAKVTSGMADLAANNPQWSAWLGVGSNLVALKVSNYGVRSAILQTERRCRRQAILHRRPHLGQHRRRQ